MPSYTRSLESHPDSVSDQRVIYELNQMSPECKVKLYRAAFIVISPTYSPCLYSVPRLFSTSEIPNTDYSSTSIDNRIIERSSHNQFNSLEPHRLLTSHQRAMCSPRMQYVPIMCHNL
ncbi:hypothetical protein C8J57DRAFT_1478291 [Mycena rebaudengoi]|nr:hypothetical protein C8J57DRAFT_1478291 [Mycena rebaudengoi]